MAPSNLGYSLQEAGRHFVRNWTTSLGAVITIFLSLFIIGLFIVGSAMVNAVIGDVEQQVTITAFISDDASDEAVEEFQDKIEGWDNVKDVTFKSKEDALESYRESSSKADATISALDGENPLPRSFVIEMNEPSQVEGMAEKIKSDEDFRQIVDDDDPSVDDIEADVDASVLYGQEEVGRMFQMIDYIRLAAVVLVALLTFVSFIFINNTIRLSITARRREIAIMRLVGASNGFIRGPFVTEGVVQALLGSLLAIGCLELVRNLVMPMVQNGLSWMAIEIPLNVYLATYGSLVLVGVFIGLFGSAIAMRRYLRV
ncbi:MULTISPECIES: permease-like cell division protein FtsX [unclassified Collinsella]|uniref:permease-like cell division protein FtsX n=1 Tax=unclassified Collinsella TaxID=2637548 RepID=UPI0011CC51E5|nr:MULTISPECIES: permease-like cell division protein FtsX [unclassified Collinsella]TXF35493.1 ABC transporter permease [Collinsella sp. BA40]